MKVVVLVGFLLPTGAVEVLAEISLLIEQSHADERQSQVTGRLEVIAGQHSEAAGKDRQALGDAELSREVCDQQFVFSVVATVPIALSGNVKPQGLGHSGHVREKRIIGCGRFQRALIHRSQQENGVVARGFPKIAVDPAKQFDSGVIPTPTQVMGDFQKGREGWWQGGADLEGANRFHRELSRAYFLLLKPCPQSNRLEGMAAQR